MKRKTYSQVQSLLLLSAMMILGCTFYFEFVKGLQPCPLCFMQRLSVFLFGFCCLLSLFAFSIRRACVMMGFQTFFAVSGLFFSTRQIWLQLFATTDSAMCMPGLNALFHYFSWSDLLKTLFWGAADCAEVTWSFLGLSMPMWSALYFLILFVISIVVLCQLNISRHNFELSESH